MGHMACFSLYVWFSRAGMILAAGPDPSCAEFPWEALQFVPKTCFYLFVKVQFGFIITRSVREATEGNLRRVWLSISQLGPGFQVRFGGLWCVSGAFLYVSGLHLHQSQCCWCTNSMIK